jgi:hypothetical protein
MYCSPLPPATKYSFAAAGIFQLQHQTIKPLIMITRITTILMAAAVACSCKKSNADTTTPTTPTTPTVGTNVPAVYAKVYGATQIYIENGFVVFKSTALPDHKSPYYTGTAWAATKYEAYNGSNGAFVFNPNRIAQFSMTFKVPLHAAPAASPQATPGGPIGIAVNGVPFFNQYAAGGSPLTGEINSFDQYNGHPQQQGQYHYHVEPLYLTATKGSSALMGFLLDGYPVYGPMENGATITNANLDAYHGHTGVTADYPGGTYHYHFTAASPYLNGNGFYGTAGTVSQ